MERLHLRSRSTRVSRPSAPRWLLSFFAVLIWGSHARAQTPKVPLLGSRIPEYVLMKRTGDQECRTDVNHRDPCASIKIKNILFTVAWDADTKAITYLFTEDRRFVGDSELGVGGLCNVAPKVGEPVAFFSYMNWLVTPKWAGTPIRTCRETQFGMQRCKKMPPDLGMPESPDSCRVDT